MDDPNAAVAPAKRVEDPPPVGEDSSKFGRNVARYAEWYLISFFAIVMLVWLCHMPWRSLPIYAVPGETELCAKIAEAEKLISADGKSPIQQTDGCPTRTQLTKVSANESVIQNAMWMDAVQISSDKPPTDPAAILEELRADLVVWLRFEYELKTFEWGRDLNLYLYSTLRFVVILLSAITPALILANSLQKKKFIAALPAAIVAVAAACISEFDYKEEAAAYQTAFVQCREKRRRLLQSRIRSMTSLTTGLWLLC